MRIARRRRAEGGEAGEADLLPRSRGRSRRCGSTAARAPAGTVPENSSRQPLEAEPELLQDHLGRAMVAKLHLLFALRRVVAMPPAVLQH